MVLKNHPSILSRTANDVVTVQFLHIVDQRLDVLLAKDLIGGTEAEKAARRVQTEEVARLQLPGDVVKVFYCIDVVAHAR